jgi:predicted transcriptional regulator
MKSQNTHCLTLRLDPQLDELLCEAAWERRQSKAAWIRVAIKQSLGITRERPRQTPMDRAAGEIQ